MAIKKTFKVQGGIEVNDSATFNGVLKASGLTYPTSDGNNSDVLKTDGSGNLTFGRVKISEIDDVLIAGLIHGGLLQYDSAYQVWRVSNTIDENDQNIITDGGTYE